ncbi:MAG: pyrroline-5-carboxylate reductase [Pseudomonadota bacterium]
MNFSLSDKKVGFIGMGNMGQAILSALMESGTLEANQVFVHNRTPGKAQKMVKKYGVKDLSTPEEVVESADIIILGTKPQDLLALLEPLRQIFTSEKVAISLAAGVQLSTLKKYATEAHWVRLIPNTPIFVQRAVVNFCLAKPDLILEKLVKKLFSPLGHVVSLEEGEEFSAMMVASSSGTGFIFELMKYWQDWIEDYGIDSDEARKIVTETFLGSALLATEDQQSSFDQLIQKVASKKGVTAAGLESMRELELEGLMRMSFNKALMRDKQLAKENS